MPISSSTAATVNLRPDLASFFEFDVEMEKQGFVGTQVLPVVNVGLQSDNPGKIPLEQLLFNAETARASGSGYNRGNWKFERFTYATEEHGWEEPVDDRDAARYGEIIQAEMVATLRAQSIIARNYEARVAAAVFNATTWAQSGNTGSSPGTLGTAVVHEWDDAANAVPITDVELAVQKVYDNSGLKANALVINWKTFRNLRNCETIIDRINSAGAGSPSKASDVTVQMLAQVFDLDKIIVAGASQNTAKEGQAASVSQIWSNEYAMVCRISDSIDMRDPCIGRTFHWTGDGSALDGVIEQYRDETVRGDIIRCRFETDEVIMYPQAGYLLSNIKT
jgi:hypothetical protein